MIGHLLVQEFDIVPASLSEKIIKDLLCETLSFNGVILTDAMNMKALKDYDNPCSLALKAGADVILHPDDPYKATNEIKSAYERGNIFDKRIKDSLRKIDKLRKIIPSSSYLNWQSLLQNKINQKDIFKKTVTVIKNDMNPINPTKVVAYLAGTYSDAIKNILEEHFKVVYRIEDLKQPENIPILAIFTDIGFGKKHCLSESELASIKKFIISNDVIIVSFGNPYVLVPFKRAKTILAIYDCHEIAVKAFIEEFIAGLKSTGRLPINIPWTDD